MSEPPAAASASLPGPSSRARSAVRSPAWLELVLRPERFFPDGARRLQGPGLALAILLVGANAVVGRLDLATLRGLSASGEISAPETWPVYWATVALGAVVGGPIAYFVWGWLFHLRVVWSGASQRDPGLAKRICLLANLVVAVPILLWQGAATLLSSDPGATWLDQPMALTTIVVPFYSVYIGYRGVRSSYDVSRGRALFWFAILPAGLLTLGMSWGVLASTGWWLD